MTSLLYLVGLAAMAAFIHFQAADHKRKAAIRSLYQ